MVSPRFREAAQSWVQGCCPTPLLGPAEPERPVAKTRSTSSSCRLNFVATTASSLFPHTHFTNHESIPCLQESFLQFIKAYPSYSDTAPIDQIRGREFGHLSLSNRVFLDYMGVGLFSQSQSDSPLFSITFKPVTLKSQLHHGGQGSELESGIKKRIMDFLNISENDYTMVFTTNRSAAFKLVAESYPFRSSTRKLVTVYDHESEVLEAMIRTSEKRGAHVMAAEFKWPRLRIHSARLRKMIVRKNAQRGLFVFPLQSRMSGARYSYQWLTLAQEHGWHVLLDACALGPKDMDSFGLSLFRPDFLICSFYKVFGENPTGFGCLFVKKSILPILECSQGAGIVAIIPPKDFPEDSSGTDTELEQIFNQPSKNQKSEEEKEEKEGRKSNIQCRCLDHVDSFGLTLIGSRGRYLTNWLVTALTKLQHPNRLDSFPLVTIYGPKVKFDRAPALAFNIHDWKGETVEPALVQKLADRNNIALTHGFLHHVLFADKYQQEQHKILGKGKESTGRKGERPAGITVVTAALTFLADFEDVYRLWAFVARFLDADFVERERWRYTALDQKTVQV